MLLSTITDSALQCTDKYNYKLLCTPIPVQHLSFSLLATIVVKSERECDCQYRLAVAAGPHNRVGARVNAAGEHVGYAHILVSRA